MNITPIQPSKVDASNVPVEELVGNKHLNEQQKIAEASRQFEAIMLKQILSESQKPVITSEFTDNSTAAGIYQDYITNTLADSMSKAGTLGLAKVFEQQLSHPPVKHADLNISHKLDSTAKPASIHSHNQTTLSTAHHE